MTQPARDLLQALFSPVVGTAAFIELVGIWGGDPKFPKNVARPITIALDDVDWLDYAIENAEQISSEKENVYFGPNPRTTPVGPGHPRSVEVDVEVVVALWADADPPKDKTTREQVDPNWKAAHRDAVAERPLPLPPSARVDSGHGYHYYWFLKEPCGNVEACKAMLKRIMSVVPDADDKVTHLSRILRLPGWPNVKNPEKPIPVTLDWCHDHLRYSFEEIVRAFPEKKAETKPARPRVVETSPRKRELEDKERDCLVGLWNPGQRHDLALALAGAMRKAGWTEEDAGAEIALLGAKAGDDEQRHDNVRSTWAKPIEQVQGWKELKVLGVSPSLLPTLNRPHPATLSDDERPVVEVRPDDHAVVEDAIVALEREGGVFRRGHNLVRVLRDERQFQDPRTKITFPVAAPRITTLPLPSLQELLAKNAVWIKRMPTRDGDDRIVRVPPPDRIVREVAARASWPRLRLLNDVVEVPVLRPDGTVLSEAGYDPQTGLLFEPRGEVLPLPEKPTKRDAEKAVDDIWDLVSDFPFSTDVHRAAWVAMTLTPLARYAFAGCTPAMIISSNKRGSGKGLLADLSSVISIGRELARSPNPEQPEELRKRITAVALEGVRVVLIDNVEGVFGSSAFDAVITSTSWNDRILGESTNTPALPLNTMWVVTGNNVDLRGDLPRRALMVRLDSPHEHPERREDFRNSDLLAHAKANQPRLTQSALTILSAFVAAGRPQQKLPPWGSFIGWSSLVRQAIAWVGLPDVGEARAEGDVTVEVAEVSAQRQVLHAWAEVDPGDKGLTAAELLSKLRSATADLSYPKMRAAIMEFAPTQRGDLPTPRQLGARFRSIRRAVFDGLFLDMRTVQGESRWRVVQTVEQRKVAT